MFTKRQYVDYLVAATGNDTCMHLADHQEGAQAVSHDAVSDDFDPRITKSTGDPGCSVPGEAALDPENPAIAFNTTAGWVEVTNPGALSASWAAATCAPTAENTGDTPRVFWRFLQWNTQKSPHVHADEEFTDYVPLMGHNGSHTLAITEVDGQPAQEIAFTRAAGSYAAGPTPRKTNVQNLVITTLSADKGTIDYLKYDPDPESPYNRPRVYFTIKDVGDAHQHYFCVLYLQPTASDAMQRLGPNGCEAWDGGWAVQGPGSYYFEWDGTKDPGDDDPETPGVQHDPTDECDWGTYTYDVGVFEYDAAGEFDWFLYKWPYCLSDYAHDVWYQTITEERLIPIINPDTGEVIEIDNVSVPIGIELRCAFGLHDAALASSFNLHVDPQDVKLMPIDEALAEYNCLGQLATPIHADVYYDGIDSAGITAWRYDAFPKTLGWRVVFTAVDGCWVGYRRDHSPSRMLAFNKRGDEKLSRREKSESKSNPHYVFWSVGLPNDLVGHTYQRPGTIPAQIRHLFQKDYDRVRYCAESVVLQDDDFKNSLKYFEFAGRADKLGMKEGARAYFHYRDTNSFNKEDAEGSDLIIDYEKAFKECSAIREVVYSEIRCAQYNAERLAQEHGNYFTMTGHIETIHYKTSKKIPGLTLNWQLAVGGHVGRATATVMKQNSRYTMTFIFYAYDLYNFNPGDIATVGGFPDNDNVIFEQVGWAKKFWSRGSLYRIVEWDKGDYENTEISQPN